MRAANPEHVIETALDRNRDAAPSIQTNAVMQALKSNGLRIVRDTTSEITYCPSGKCIRVRTENGRCKVCGWPDEDRL